MPISLLTKEIFFLIFSFYEYYSNRNNPQKKKSGYGTNLSPPSIIATTGLEPIENDSVAELTVFPLTNTLKLREYEFSGSNVYAGIDNSLRLFCIE